VFPYYYNEETVLYSLLKTVQTSGCYLIVDLLLRNSVTAFFDFLKCAFNGTPKGTQEIRVSLRQAVASNAHPRSI